MTAGLAAPERPPRARQPRARVEAPLRHRRRGRAARSGVAHASQRRRGRRRRPRARGRITAPPAARAPGAARRRVSALRARAESGRASSQPSLARAESARATPCRSGWNPPSRSSTPKRAGHAVPLPRSQSTIRQPNRVHHPGPGQRGPGGQAVAARPRARACRRPRATTPRAACRAMTAAGHARLRRPPGGAQRAERRGRPGRDDAERVAMRIEDSPAPAA